MLRLLLGIAAHVPMLDGRVVNRGTGGTDRAEYCYGVWLKHLTLLEAAGRRGVPASVAELGPGDSLGVGLAALLSGASSYRALDVKRFCESERNQRVMDELVELLRARAPRPTAGWPDFDQHLDDRLFPAHILTDEVLEHSLAPPRLDSIRQAIAHGASSDGTLSLKYVAPWETAADVERGSVDLLLSHSVLEHVRDLDHAARATFQWLKPGGWASHQIDLTSHGLASKWNGAWGVTSERYWSLLAGKRDCWINRQPASVQLATLERAGLELRRVDRKCRRDGLARAELARRWEWLSDDDMETAGLFVQARRPEGC